MSDRRGQSHIPQGTHLVHSDRIVHAAAADVLDRLSM